MNRLKEILAIISIMLCVNITVFADEIQNDGLRILTNI